ncbi:MAG TPA: TetR/AcrR family transcriptional regulator [Solirubrobacteraceae bacterium]|jgi:AcrR family transcriptional regulator|nr:TetR/AcrR family transcriptional regulator [Solirubrobacteraceae bacterium]
MPAARRDQILDIGAEQFAARPYEQVHIVDVAAIAGISRALVYRYFPTKRDLFAGVYKRASERLLAASEIVPGLTLAEQVLAGLEAHFDFFIENARTVLVANRGALAGDPLIEGIISEELAELRGRMLDAGGLQGRERVRASIALSGWLAFVRAVCVEWLADSDRTLTREDVREMCLSALISALGGETTETTPPELE